MIVSGVKNLLSVEFKKLKHPSKDTQLSIYKNGAPIVDGRIEVSPFEIINLNLKSLDNNNFHLQTGDEKLRLEKSPGFIQTQENKFELDEFITAKQSNGYSEIHGKIYEKTEANKYLNIEKIELMDKGSNVKFSEHPVIDGAFDIVGIAANDYTLKFKDPTGKYNTKEISVKVTKQNEDLINPKIVLGSSKTNIIEPGEKFKQIVHIKNCLSSTVIFEISNKPSWIELTKISEKEYLVSGIPPKDSYGINFELIYNLSDYRASGIKTTTISKNYTLQNNGRFKEFNKLNDPDLTYVGNVELSEYNGMKGLTVNGKTNTVKLTNTFTEPYKTNNFTIMYAFTILKFNNLQSTHNIIVALSGTPPQQFWLGFTPTQDKNPFLSIVFGNREIRTNTRFEEGKTYFLKVVRHNNTSYVYVNNRLSVSWADSDYLRLLNSEIMFGDAGWNDHKMSLMIHEFNHIHDLGDINNTIRFKSTKVEINYLNFNRMYLYKFMSTPLKYNSISNKLQLVGRKYVYPYTKYLENNATTDNILLNNSVLDEYTIKFEVEMTENKKSTIFEFSAYKVHFENNKIIFTILGNIVHSESIGLNFKYNFEIIYSNKKLYLYNNGFKIYNNDSLQYHLQLNSDIIYLGYGKEKDISEIMSGKLYKLDIYQGVMYSGEHTYTNTFDSNTSLTSYNYVGNIINNFASEEIIITNFLTELSPTARSGVTIKEFDGRKAWAFDTNTDYFMVQTPDFQRMRGLDMTFDFYFGGMPEDVTTQSIVSSINYLNQTNYEWGMFTSTVYREGTGYKLYAGFAGIMESPRMNIKIGWNKIRIYKSVNDYYLYLYVNDVFAGHNGGTWSEFGLGWGLGNLIFGKNTFDPAGIAGCGISNFQLSLFK